MKLKLSALGFLVATAASLSSLSAGTFLSSALLIWDTSGLIDLASQQPPLQAATIDPNLEIGSGLNLLTRVGVVANVSANASYSSGTFFSTGWNINGFDQSIKYISFVVAPAAGFQLTLDSLDFTIIGTNTAPRNGLWGYSLDGGATFVFGPEMTLVNKPSAPPSATWTFDTPIVTDGSVEFRFWSYGSTDPFDAIGNTSNASGGGGIRIDDGMTLNGSLAAVPEPATYAFVGLALAGFVVIYGRSRQMKAARQA